MRYSVHDETGLELRRFWTLEEAEYYLLPGYTLVTRPAVKRQSAEETRLRSFSNLLSDVGESPF